jgi:hypothetical protein
MKKQKWEDRISCQPHQQLFQELLYLSQIFL